MSGYIKLVWLYKPLLPWPSSCTCFVFVSCVQSRVAEGSSHPPAMECLFDSALEESVFPVDDAAGVPVNTVIICPCMQCKCRFICFSTLQCLCTVQFRFCIVQMSVTRKWICCRIRTSGTLAMSSEKESIVSLQAEEVQHGDFTAGVKRAWNVITADRYSFFQS